jgi:hypothetical protein
MKEQPLNRSERDAFEALRDMHGQRLDPRHVVDAARPSESPLHGRFEWRDDVAAERYRLQQAGQLIVRARVVITPRKQEPVRVRPAAPLPPVPSSRYSPPRLVPPTNTNNAGGSLDDARRELAAVRGKFSGMRELSSLFIEIEKLLNPGKIGSSAVTDAALLALNLESRGHDRQNATARAAAAYGVNRHEVLEAVRKAS